MKYIGLLMTIMIISCTTDNNSTTQTVTDITDAIFQNRNATCDDYVNQFKSNVLDVGQSTYFTGAVTISIDNNKCQFSSNSIPNHNFNDGPTKFANDVDYVESTYSITSMPSVGESITDLSIQYDNAIFLNGAKLDLIAAACKGVDDEKKGVGLTKVLMNIGGLIQCSLGITLEQTRIMPMLNPMAHTITMATQKPCTTHLAKQNHRSLDLQQMAFQSMAPTSLIMDPSERLILAIS